MKADVRVVLKKIIALWNRHGWSDYDDAALTAARLLCEGEITSQTINKLPDTFFTFNHVSHAKTLQVLEQIQVESGVTTRAIHIDILMLSASPDFVKDRLRVDKEHRAIIKRIQSATHRDRLAFHTLPAVEPQDIIDELNRVKPTILQISSHGDTDGILLDGADLNQAVLTSIQLSKILKSLSPKVRIVILNSCHSYKQAKSLTKYVDIAIGMSRTVGDNAAIAFASQFYSSLGEGVTIQAAFDQALVSVDIASSTYSDAPRLYARKGVDPKGYKLL